MFFKYTGVARLSQARVVTYLINFGNEQNPHVVYKTYSCIFYINTNCL